MTWEGQVRSLIARVDGHPLPGHRDDGVGPEDGETPLWGLWSLLAAAELALLHLALVPGADEGLRLSDAATELGAAVDELERRRPGLLANGAGVNLGPAPADDVTGCRAAIQELLWAGGRQLGRLCQDPDLPFGDALGVACAANALTAAWLRLGWDGFRP